MRMTKKNDTRDSNTEELMEIFQHQGEKKGEKEKEALRTLSICVIA